MQKYNLVLSKCSFNIITSIFYYFENVHFGIQCCYISKCKKMINHLFQNSNISIPDIGGKTPLHYAAKSKSLEAVQCVQMLLVRRLKKTSLYCSKARRRKNLSIFLAIQHLRYKSGTTNLVSAMKLHQEQYSITTHH